MSLGVLANDRQEPIISGKPALKNQFFSHMPLNSFEVINILSLEDEGVPVVRENTNNGGKELNPLARTPTIQSTTSWLSEVVGEDANNSDSGHL